MAFKFFWIPLTAIDQRERELNAFLGTHRIEHVERSVTGASDDASLTRPPSGPLRRTKRSPVSAFPRAVRA